jgi:anti-anti-sigma factor
MPEASSNFAIRMEKDVLVLQVLHTQITGDDVAEAMRQELGQALDTSKPKKVVLDFQNVKYMSSVGFRPLLSLRRKMHEVDGRMVLCGLSPFVADVLRTVRLISTYGTATAPFDSAADVPSALALLK